MIEQDRIDEIEQDRIDKIKEDRIDKLKKTGHAKDTQPQVAPCKPKSGSVAHGRRDGQTSPLIQS